MNPAKTFLFLLCSMTLGVSLSACGISTLGGSGGGGAGGSGACEEPDPSDGACHANDDCAAGEVCAPAGCRPSTCTCSDTGEWSCTEDCAGTCTPAADACEGANPADAGCSTGDDCDAGEICAQDACAPSTCECDPATGQWGCSKDCRPACQKVPPSCPGDPNGLVCDVYLDGFTCPPGAQRTVIDCRPLCQDIATCQEVAPVEGFICAGENPQGCFEDGCPDGEICVDEGCVPSICGCDPATGQWTCTDDCNGGTCIQGP